MYREKLPNGTGPSGTKATGVRKRSAKEQLAEMDEAYCVLRFGNNVRIFAWEESEIFPGSKRPAFYTEAALRLFFRNQMISCRDKNGQSNRKPLFPYWLDRADSPRATGLTLEPTPERFVGGKLNLWSGFGLDPVAGKWPLLKAHIEHGICNDDPQSISYLMKWLAWVVQNPTRNAEVAVVLRGKKGTGKGVFGRLLLSIFASHGQHISSRDHLTGKFNSHLMHCCFLFVDEALWPGDVSGEGVLKRMITEPTLTVEPKGIDALEAVNRLSIFMASNAGWVVPASSDERRFACFDVLDRGTNEGIYFEALYNELKSQGGAEAFLYDMLHMELGTWHPRSDVPQTKALAAQQLESAPPDILWLGQILDRGALPQSVRDSGEILKIIDSRDPSLARSRLLWLSAKESDPRWKYLTEPKFRRFLEDYGVIREKRKSSGSFWRFPPLQEARARFREVHPWYPAFDDSIVDWHTDLESMI